MKPLTPIEHAAKAKARNAAFELLDINPSPILSTADLFIRVADSHGYEGHGGRSQTILAQLAPFVDLTKQSDAFLVGWNFPEDITESLQEDLDEETGERLVAPLLQFSQFSPLRFFEPAWIDWASWDAFKGADPVVGADSDGLPVTLLQFTFARCDDKHHHWYPTLIEIFDISKEDIALLVERLERELLIKAAVSSPEGGSESHESSEPDDSGDFDFYDLPGSDDAGNSGSLEGTTTLHMLVHLVTLSMLADRPNVPLWNRVFDCLPQDPSKPRESLAATLMDFCGCGTLTPAILNAFRAFAEESPEDCQQLLEDGIRGCEAEVVQLALSLGARASSVHDEGRTALEVIGLTAKRYVDAVVLCLVDHPTRVLLHSALAHEEAMRAIHTMDAGARASP